MQALWPTATATDAKASGAAGYSTDSGRHSGTTLTDAAVRFPTWPVDALWATATARDWKSGEHSEATAERNARPLNEQAWAACHHGPLAPLMKTAGVESWLSPPGSPRLSLNPAFVAWLMGWHWLLAGLTESSCSECSETASSRTRPPKRCVSSGPQFSEPEAA